MTIPNIDFKPSQANTYIEIIDLEDIYQRKPSLNHDPEAPHRVGFNMMLYIAKGEGKHFIDFDHRSFSSDTFIFIRKNQIHAFDLSSRPQGKAILFTNEFIREIQKNMRAPLFWSSYLHHLYSPLFKPSPELLPRCGNLLTEIAHETQRQESESVIIMHLFVTLFHMIERERHAINTSSPKASQKLEQFLNLLEQQFTITRNASDYADQMHMSYKALNTHCKQTTGKTSKQLIDIYTIQEAKRRLILENKPIQRLSEELGFDETTNFVKYFKVILNNKINEDNENEKAAHTNHSSHRLIWLIVVKPASKGETYEPF